MHHEMDRKLASGVKMEPDRTTVSGRLSIMLKRVRNEVYHMQVEGWD